MPTPQSEPFGFLPVELDVVSGDVEINTGANLSETVNEVMGESAVIDGWLYAPRARQYVMGHGMYELPYASRVFGLPKTHVITNRSPDGEDHIAFLLWALSFFLGMRLSATEAGFLDATPIERNKVVDFLPPPTKAILELAETFWKANRATPRRLLRVSGVIHALFLGPKPTPTAVRVLLTSIHRIRCLLCAR